MRSLRFVWVPFVVAVSAAAQWPEFRGPTRDGRAPDARVPLEWSEGKNVLWKTEIPGEGWSSPVVDDGRIWLTAAEDGGRALFAVCVDLVSGRELHRRRVFEVEKPQKKNRLNSYASPSPCVCEGRVFVHFGTYGTACLDGASGEKRWERRDIRCDHMEGPGSSPMIVGDLVIFNMDGGDVQFVIALDQETGETRWKTDRSVEFGKLAPDFRKAYGTPILLEVAGDQQLISTGARATVAYDPETGDELWKLPHKGFSMSARAVAGDGLVFLNTGFMRARVVAMKLVPDEGILRPQIVWEHKRSVPTIPSALWIDGLLYMVNNTGVASCLDAATGEQVWKHRIGGEHCASPVYAGGRIYFFDRLGRSFVIEPGREFRVLAENKLDRGFMASPAVLPDGLILRTETHLYRIGQSDR